MLNPTPRASQPRAYSNTAHVVMQKCVIILYMDEIMYNVMSSVDSLSVQCHVIIDLYERSILRSARGHLVQKETIFPVLHHPVKAFLDVQPAHGTALHDVPLMGLNIVQSQRL